MFRPVLVLLALLALPLSASAQETKAAPNGILGLVPQDVSREGRVTVEGATLAYTATVGSLDLYASTGEQTAKIVYTAYSAKTAQGTERPITFAFNGGPGAASAYLHLGLVGPKILTFGADGTDGTQPVLIDNPESWLAFTDLVLIDPVGTGWSRAASADVANSFYGVRQDAESLAKAIMLYTQKAGRLSAPKYLLGESYGGFRAAKVAAALKENQGLLVSGILMVSPFIEGRFLANSDDPLSAALQLPSMAAATLERTGRFSAPALAEAERFAMGDYLTGLATPPREREAADALYSQVATLTGLPPADVARARGFVGEIYAKQAAGQGRIVSPYDAAYSVPDAYPEEPDVRNDDPILDGYSRAYGAAFSTYARDALGVRTPMTYSLLNTDVNRRWEWNGSRGGDGRALAGASGDLRDLLSTIPAFRLMIVHGRTDVLTPYGASRYVIDHLPPDLAAGRAHLHVYPGGHMFYTDATARRAFTADAKAFYEAGTAE